MRTKTCHKMNWPALVVILSLLLFGCGGHFYTEIDQGKVSGTWDLTLTPSNGAVRATKLSITQEKRYDPFSGTTSDNATLTGTFEGNNVVIILNNADGSTTTLSGGASNEWITLSGTYTSTGPDGAGTWRADKEVAPPGVSVSPQSATLSCSAGDKQTFTVTGGTVTAYKVTPTSNGTLVTIDTSNLTSNGRFTVTANACSGTTGSTVVELTVTDSVTSATVQVTISNP